MRALVLSGGGAKGSYQIGAYKALKKLHINFDIVCGTSVGALNAGFIVQNKIRSAESVWKNMSFKVVFGSDSKSPTKLKEIYMMYAKNFIKNGGSSTDGLRELIEEHLDVKKFYNSKMNFGLITYDVDKSKPIVLTKKDIPKDKLIDFLIASSACYPAIKPIEIDNEKYVDGGYYDNLPIDLAKSMGANEIVAIDLKAPGFVKSKINKKEITYIKPSNKLSNFLDFNKKQSIRNMRYGYLDTLKAYNKLEGKTYYFKPDSISNNIKLYKDTYLYIVSKIFDINKIPSNIKNIVKTIDNKFDLDYTLMLEILEYIGSVYNIDNTIIYSNKSFNKKIIKILKIKRDNYKYTTRISKSDIDNLYMLLRSEKYSEVKKALLLNYKNVLCAIYLYTLDEI